MKSRKGKETPCKEVIRLRQKVKAIKKELSALREKVTALDHEMHNDHMELEIAVQEWSRSGDRTRFDEYVRKGGRV